MSARERVARAWHEGSDHAADGTPFGGPLCNCDQVAGRMLPMLAGARVEAVRRAAQDNRLIDSCATAAAQGWLTRYANDIETEEDRHVDQ